MLTIPEHKDLKDLEERLRQEFMKQTHALHTRIQHLEDRIKALELPNTSWGKAPPVWHGPYTPVWLDGTGYKMGFAQNKVSKS